MIEIFTVPFILLILSTILTLSLYVYISKVKNKNQLQKCFCLDLLCLFIICIGIILQTVLSNLYNIPAIYFENFIYWNMFPSSLHLFYWFNI